MPPTPPSPSSNLAEPGGLQDVRLDMKSLRNPSKDSDLQSHVEHSATQEEGRTLFAGNHEEQKALAIVHAAAFTGSEVQAVEDHGQRAGSQEALSSKQELLQDNGKLSAPQASAAFNNQMNPPLTPAKNEENVKSEQPNAAEGGEHVPEPWCNGPRKYMDQPASGAWETLQKLVEKHDKEMCAGWKDDLDTMLVFTGLFSAAVTAFCIESFNSLSQSPADTTNTLLILISEQLTNSSITAATSAHAGSNFVAANSAVHINVLYFVSLALALSVSSICILAKQWIREFTQDVAVSSHDSLRVRQAHYDGLIAWKVPQILSTLPVILQAALLLFFAGLLVQLWNVDNHAAAIAVTLIVLLLLFFVVFTTVLPTQRKGHQDLYKRFTPFHSPQAWIFFAAWQQICQLAVHAQDFLCWPCTRLRGYPILSSWADFDTKFIERENFRASLEAQYPNKNGTYFLTSSHRVLRWISQVVCNAHQVEASLLWCISNPSEPSRVPPTSLAQYVLNQSQNLPPTSEILCYELSSSTWSIGSISSPRGKSQVEMLIRAANQGISVLLCGGVLESLYFQNILFWLWGRHGVFSQYHNQEMCQYQQTVIIQIAVLLRNVLNSQVVVAQFQMDEWDIFNRLFFALGAHAKSARSQLVVNLTEDILNNRFPQAFQESKSVKIMIGVALDFQEYARQSLIRLSYGLRLFTSLDAIMVHWCLCPQETKDLDLKQLEQWHSLRTEMRKISSKMGKTLSEDYFDSVNRPLPTVQELQEHLALLKAANTALPASVTTSEADLEARSLV